MPNNSNIQNQSDKFLPDSAKENLWRVVVGYKSKREAALSFIGQSKEAFKEKVSISRSGVFDDFEKNLEIAKENLRNNGFEIHEAENGTSAAKILQNLLFDSQKIVKSKSNTFGELDWNDLKGEKKINETDLGDFIAQIFNQEEAHYVLPAINLKSAEISQKIKEVFGDDVAANAAGLTRYLCDKIREKILAADTGITGANFFTLDGRVALLENEGNISLVSRLPQRHIIICGIDKLVSDVESAMEFCRAAAVFGTGQIFTQYVSVISGPSKTADIENELVSGAQGARQVHLILLDNGRRKMLEDGFGELLRCINCGACLNFCPVYHQMGRSYGSRHYIGSKGIAKMIFEEAKSLDDVEVLKSAKEAGSFNCTLCENCFENCPMKINLPAMVRKIRGLQNGRNLGTESNQKMLENVKKFGNPFGEIKNNQETPKELFCC